jgi:Flp pilus assembly pilin Flp
MNMSRMMLAVRRSRLVKALSRRDGQTAVEWTLIIGVIAIIILAASAKLSPAVGEFFDGLAKTIRGLIPKL